MDSFLGDNMKKILKVIMTLVLICSCFYLAISLFMNHLIINDMVPTVVKSTAVTNALRKTTNAPKGVCV